MKVRAFSTHSVPQWRWRIVDYDGQTIEESTEGFATIAAAMTEGNARVRVLKVTPPADGAS